MAKFTYLVSNIQMFPHANPAKRASAVNVMYMQRANAVDDYAKRANAVNEYAKRANAVNVM